MSQLSFYFLLVKINIGLIKFFLPLLTSYFINQINFNAEFATLMRICLLQGYHSMARANQKKVNTSQLLLTQHQSTYPRGPEIVSIEIPLSDLTL